MGGGNGPTVARWESLSEQEKESWLEEASTMHGWVVWCRSKKGAEEIQSFELSGNKIMMKQNQKRRRTKRTGAKRRNIGGRVYDTGNGTSKATSKLRCVRITLYAGFTKISLSQQNKNLTVTR